MLLLYIIVLATNTRHNVCDLGLTQGRRWVFLGHVVHTIFKSAGLAFFAAPTSRLPTRAAATTGRSECMDAAAADGLRRSTPMCTACPDVRSGTIRERADRNNNNVDSVCLYHLLIALFFYWVGPRRMW